MLESKCPDCDGTEDGVYETATKILEIMDAYHQKYHKEGGR